MFTLHIHLRQDFSDVLRHVNSNSKWLPELDVNDGVLWPREDPRNEGDSVGSSSRSVACISRSTNAAAPYWCGRFQYSWESIQSFALSGRGSTT